MLILYGPVINPVGLTSYDAFPRCLIVVGNNGTIDWMVEDVAESMIQEELAQKGLIDVDDVHVLHHGEFLIPGFIDTHIHAPQVPNIGRSVCNASPWTSR